MLTLPSLVTIALEILAILVFLIVLFNPIIWQYLQYNNWKKLSAEYGFQYTFHMMYPEMKGEFRGHSIAFQNTVDWGGRTPWSQLQIWIQLTNEIPIRFYIHQKGNRVNRPPSLGELEKQKMALEYLGERYVWEGNSAAQNTFPLHDQHLVNLFTDHKCIGLAVDGQKIYYERNDILCSVEELNRIINELLFLAETIER